MRSVLYRFPEVEALLRARSHGDPELALPEGELVGDGEWILAVFELGPSRRATSAAGRAVVTPDGASVCFEPRDWQRLFEFASQGGADESESEEPATMRFIPDQGPVTTRSPSKQTSATDEDPPTRGPRARVLIVDDDPDIRQVVSAMLDAVGLAVASVGSAEEALVRMEAEPFDLLVLDWNLPKMTGLDLCRAVRRSPSHALLPVLFLTANASSQDMVEAFASGGDDYVVKPFRAPELGARIFSLLRRARRWS